MSLDSPKMPTQRWLEIYPHLADADLTPEQHTSPEHFKRELDLVFRRTWLFAGIESDIPKAGDFIVRDFTALKVSVLLVRGDDGKVRAFYNFCRHRGAKLMAADDSGCRRTFTCPFHGWTYALDGSLRGLPDPDGFLKKEELGLVQLPSGTWNGFIFVNLEQKPRESFEEWLGPLADHPVNKFPFLSKEWDSWGWRCEVNADWKLVKDLFIETYHVAFVHRDSVERIYASPTNPFHHLPSVKFYGKHAKGTGGSGGASGQNLKMGPIAAASVKFGGKGASRFGKSRTAEPGLNPEGFENWSLDQYSMFPNFNIHLFGGLWHYHLFEPMGIGRCSWENRIFFPKARNVAERFAHAFSQSLQVIVGLEDLAAAERNQEGLEMGAVKKLAVHDQEIQLRFMRRTLEDYKKLAEA